MACGTNTAPRDELAAALGTKLVWPVHRHVLVRNLADEALHLATVCASSVSRRRRCCCCGSSGDKFRARAPRPFFPRPGPGECAGCAPEAAAPTFPQCPLGAEACCRDADAPDAFGVSSTACSGDPPPDSLPEPLLWWLSSREASDSPAPPVPELPLTEGVGGRSRLRAIHGDAAAQDNNKKHSGLIRKRMAWTCLTTTC